MPLVNKADEQVIGTLAVARTATFGTARSPPKFLLPVPNITTNPGSRTLARFLTTPLDTAT